MERFAPARQSPSKMSKSQTSKTGITDRDDFAARLEREGLVVLEDHPFVLTAAEAPLIDPALSDGRAKNISLGPDGVRGAAAGETQGAALGALLARYRDFASRLIGELAPGYRSWLQMGRTSLRLRDVDEPAASPRKDDRRLHVDAFASQPTGGRRILRVFSNIDPRGGVRMWRVGEPFEAHAARFLDRARPALPFEAALLQALGVTRARRTPYDQLMLQIHDRSKLDADYQRTAPARDAAFEAGTSWVVFTDQVVHAAIAGRYAMEQTFYLPIEAMVSPELSPARVLERLTGRSLLAGGHTPRPPTV